MASWRAIRLAAGGAGGLDLPSSTHRLSELSLNSDDPLVLGRQVAPAPEDSLSSDAPTRHRLLIRRGTHAC